MEAKAKHEFNATADDELSFKKEAVLKTYNTKPEDDFENTKVISKEDDQNWFKAECNGKEGYIPNNYIEMKPHPWFVGKCKRIEAEDKLLERRPDQSFVQPDGAFLIRYSESAPGDFSMSVKWYKGKMSRADAEQLLLEKQGRKWCQPDGAFLVRGCESQPGEFSISVKFQDNVQHFKILRDGNGKYFLWIIKFFSINELVDYHRTASVSRHSPILLKDMINPLENNKCCRAEYDFQANGEGEIDLHKGDVLEILEEVDTHWLKGMNERSQHTGLFPRSYVKES